MRKSAKKNRRIERTGTEEYPDAVNGGFGGKSAVSQAIPALTCDNSFLTLKLHVNGGDWVLTPPLITIISHIFPFVKLKSYKL